MLDGRTVKSLRMAYSRVFGNRYGESEADREQRIAIATERIVARCSPSAYDYWKSMRDPNDQSVTPPPVQTTGQYRRNCVADSYRTSICRLNEGEIASARRIQEVRERRVRRQVMSRNEQEKSLETADTVRNMRHNPSLSPKIPTLQEVSETGANFTNWLFSENVLEDVCAVCNRLVRCKLLKYIQVEQGFRILSNMREVLAPRPFVHERARTLYDASNISYLFQDIMLAKSGCKRVGTRPNVEEIAKFRACDNCCSSLRMYTSGNQNMNNDSANEGNIRDSENLPPKHAIANNFAYAPVPLPEPLRYDERRLISLSDPRGNFCALRATPNNQLHQGLLALSGNILFWD